MHIYVRSIVIVALSFSSSGFAQTFPTESEMRDGSLFLNSKGLPQLLEYCKSRFPDSAERAERVEKATADWKERNAAEIERGRKLIEESDARNAPLMHMSVEEYRVWRESILEQSINSMIEELDSKSDGEAQVECATYESSLAS